MTERIDPAGDEAAVTRREEELQVGTETQETGRVRVKKHVETEHVQQAVPRDVEYSDGSERARPAEGDSGEVETLPDGSLSVPIFEEELVVTKRLVVRERIILRKRTVTEERLIEADLRRERAEIVTEGEVDVGDETEYSAPDS
jgi:uncharacterized protein (TIGR02271 family)